MTLDEAIKRYADNAEYESTHGNLQGYLEFQLLEKWLKELRAYRKIDDYLRAESEEVKMTREEVVNIIKSECYVFNPLDFDWSTMVNTALDIAIEALEKQDRIAQILDDCDLLETWETLDDYDLLEVWEVLKMIKEEIKK